MRDLGVGRAAAIGHLALAAALAAGALAACGASALELAAGTIAAAAAAGLGLCSLRRRLHHAVGLPLARCCRALRELGGAEASARLPEHGAPAVLALVQLCNAASRDVQERGVACSTDLQACENAFAREHLVLQSLRDAVLVLDAAGCIVFANRAAANWFDFGNRPIEGRAAIELLPDTLGDALRQCTQRLDLARAEGTQVTDLAFGVRSLDLHLMAMPDAADNPGVAAVAVFTDVTRNHEIARLKDDLLSSISHELRTPLTNLCSSTEILAQIDPEQEGEWREFVGIVHTESHRLKRLIDDVLAYGQMESARFGWQLGDHDVGHLAADAARLSAPTAKQHGLQVDLRILGSGIVHCDGPRIIEVMGRLLDNACKFGRQNGHVRVTVQSRDEVVEVAVADDGPGIAPADRQRVFDRFVQIGDVLTGKPRGAGLGLSICQRIVDAMGGTLWCEDSPLGGIQFRFVLPVHVVAGAR